LQGAQQDAKDKEAIHLGRQQGRPDQDRRGLSCRLLLSATFGLGRGVDDSSPEAERGDGLLPQQEGEVMVDVRPHSVLEFLACVTVGRAVDQETEGLGQVAVAGKAGGAAEPQTRVIEARGGGEGDEGSVVVEAVVAADLAQEALQGLSRELLLLGEIDVFGHTEFLEAEVQLSFAGGEPHDCPLLERWLKNPGVCFTGADIVGQSVNQ